jgi:hypothetical protein
VIWDDVLLRMRQNGIEVVEEVFMDNYGPIAAGKFPQLGDRYFRCMFALARAENIRFEMYVFPSATEAEDFHSLVRNRNSAWLRRNNLVFHALDGNFDALSGMLIRALGEPTPEE